MKTHARLLGMAAALAVCGLIGCKKAADGFQFDQSDPGHRGRYSGVGIYSPGPSWLKLTTGLPPADPAVAKPVDDQAIIVVTDSQTGEVRACGDLTGHCVGMNPWRVNLVKSQIAPVGVTEHLNAQAESLATNSVATATAASASDEPSAAMAAPPKRSNRHP